VHKFRGSYEHVDPARVGNETRVVVSELAGRKNVHMAAEALGLELAGRERSVLQQVKELESQGFQFEAADGSFEMLVRRSAPDYQPPFELLDYTTIVSKAGEGAARVQAMVRLRVGEEVMHTAADAAGPVHALDTAIRKALLPYYPELSQVHLVDFKVRIIDTHMGSAAKPRVLIESARGEERWTTVGCSVNIIEASWQALWDSLELPLLRGQAAREDSRLTTPDPYKNPNSILTTAEA
jgi:2-isopropylmalate synthase